MISLDPSKEQAVFHGRGAADDVLCQSPTGRGSAGATVQRGKFLCDPLELHPFQEGLAAVGVQCFRRVVQQRLFQEIVSGMKVLTCFFEKSQFLDSGMVRST